MLELIAIIIGLLITLYAMESPSASGARGLSHGKLFTRDGVLVASTSQEGLIRYRG